MKALVCWKWPQLPEADPLRTAKFKSSTLDEDSLTWGRTSLFSYFPENVILRVCYTCSVHGVHF